MNNYSIAIDNFSEELWETLLPNTILNKIKNVIMNLNFRQNNNNILSARFNGRGLFYT